MRTCGNEAPAWLVPAAGAAVGAGAGAGDVSADSPPRRHILPPAATTGKTPPSPPLRLPTLCSVSAVF